MARLMQLGWRLVVAALAGGVWACASPTARTSAPPAPAPTTPTQPRTTTLADELYVPPTSYDFSRNPALLGRVVGSAHGYFRFVNARFTTAVCRRFSDRAGQMPTVNLHGDAHLEQYSVTEHGRGLTDYEDSTSGPAVIDLTRFAVSLRLACRERPRCTGREGDLVDQFLTGYLAALDRPTLAPPAPAIVGLLRAGFSRSRRAFLEWAESLMEPPSVSPAVLEADLLACTRQIRARQPDLATTFFDVKRLGQHHLGVGSALDEKYLFRIEGPTDSPDDDVVLEIKQVRAASGAPCVATTSSLDPNRIAVGRARISHQPFRYFAYVRRGAKVFWVHEWVEHYRELSLRDRTVKLEDLLEVAYDVGAQLGRGHPSQLGSGGGEAIRERQLRFMEANQPELQSAANELADATVAAWERFRMVLGPEPGG